MLTTHLQFLVSVGYQRVIEAIMAVVSQQVGGRVALTLPTNGVSCQYALAIVLAKNVKVHDQTFARIPKKTHKKDKNIRTEN